MDPSIQHMDLIFYKNKAAISHSTLITNWLYIPGKSMF